MGRPSSGKSTFLNSLCGRKVSIVSSVPQTTRNRIRAIFNTPDMQIIFIDTPGMHFSERLYNQELVHSAQQALQEGEAILYLSDLSRSFGREERAILELLERYQENLIVGLNKVDLVQTSTIEERKQEIESMVKPVLFRKLVATDGSSCREMALALAGFLPSGPRLYPEEYYTDQPQDFRIAEIVREKLIAHTKQELPHAAYVAVDSIRFREEDERLIINAIIFVESQSQKSIVVGKGGSMIRTIGIEARLDIQEVFGYRTDLFLKVKVHAGWRKDPLFLRRQFGF